MISLCCAPYDGTFHATWLNGLVFPPISPTLNLFGLIDLEFQRRMHL